MANHTVNTTFHAPQLLWHDLRSQATLHLVAIRRALFLLASAAGVFAVLNLALMAVTVGRVMPFTQIGGASYGFMTTSEAASKLAERHNQATMVVYNQGQPITLKAAESGIYLKTWETLFQNHTGWDRLPLVAAVHNIFSRYQPIYSIDQVQLTVALAPHINSVRTEATEARIIIPPNTGEDVTITPGQPGAQITPELAAQQVAYQAENNTFAVKLVPSVIEPKFNKNQLLAILPRLEAARKSTLTIHTTDEATKVELSGAELQALIMVDTAGEELAVTLDSAKLAAYLDGKANLFYVAPVATKIGLLDGVEISRNQGVAGRMLDSTKTAEMVSQTFSQGVVAAEAIIANVDPAVIYSRSYTNSDQGLYKIIEDYASSHSGTYSVAAVELDGPGNRSAFYNADTSTITASTYKMFVGYAAMLKVESGEWTLSTPTGLGSLDSCLKDMIIVSDNNCPIAIMDMMGWKQTQTLLNDKGFTSTKMYGSSTGDKYSTARDEMKLLTGMYFSELITEQSRDYLFGYMKQQVYRSGIPAGSNGSAVADKVGFLYGLNHDMGIVYGPKATYALVILTDGAGGFRNVRDLSQKIYDFYNQ